MRVGLIGDPVEHSRSPMMHNAAFAHLGMDHEYELWLTDELEIPSRVASIRGSEIAGANVTVPHKQAVMPHLDEISETALRIGAVNTIIPRDGRLIGDNTDAYGFRQSVLERFPDGQSRQALVLGAGGASRAVIVALQQMGVAVPVIANRTVEKAASLGKEIGGQGIAWDDIEGVIQDMDIIVNTTSLGWHDEEVIPTSLMRHAKPGAIAVDLTYRHTPFLQFADDHGLRTLDGLGMLIHQGARSFELWFGTPAPVDVMRNAISH